MTALTDFNAVVSGVLAGLNTTFPLPVTLEAQAVAEGFNVTLLEAELALRWLMSSGYVKTLLGHTELDPSHLAGVVLTRKGLLVVSGLPASLIPATASDWRTIERATSKATLPPPITTTFFPSVTR